MDLVFAIGRSRVITHRVPLHGEFSVRLLDLVLVGVPLEPEDVVEVLASAAAPHLSRLLVKRFPRIGRVGWSFFPSPSFQASRRGEPAGSAWAEPTREARYGGRRVLKAVRAREGRRCVRWVCATPPRSPSLPARPRKGWFGESQKIQITGGVEKRTILRASGHFAWAFPRSTFARRCRLPRYPRRGPSRRRWTARTDGPRASATAAGPTASTSRCQSTIRGEAFADPRRPRERGVPRKVRR